MQIALLAFLLNCGKLLTLLTEFWLCVLEKGEGVSKKERPFPIPAT